MGKIRYSGHHTEPVDEPVIGKHHYDLGGPLKIQVPHLDDFIIPATARVLTKYNKESYRRAADPLLVEALSASPSRCYEHGTAPATHLLVRAQTFIKVQVKLKFHTDACPTRTGGRPVVLFAAAAAATVMVRNGDDWLPLADWLPTLPAQRMRNLSAAALELQRKAWIATGQHFRFLDLPQELRDRILLLAIGEYIEPRHITKYHSTTGLAVRKITNLTGNGLEKAQRSDRTVNTLHPRLKPVNPALLGINKALRSVALHILWLETTKRYQSLTTFREIPSHVPRNRLTNIRRVELALTHLEYIEMFRCQTKPFERHTWPSTTVPALILNQLSSLQYLELFFMSTVEQAYSPWDFLAAWDPEVVDDADRGVDLPRLPCQKVLVDWILTFAAEHLTQMTHITKFKLSGFIKTATKQKWEGILNAQKRGEHADFIESERQAIMTLPDFEFPPHCRCPYPCGDTAVNLQGLLYSGTRSHEFARAARVYEFDYDDTSDPKGRDGYGQDVSDRFKWMRTKLYKEDTAS